MAEAEKPYISVVLPNGRSFIFGKEWDCIFTDPSDPAVLVKKEGSQLYFYGIAEMVDAD